MRSLGLAAIFLIAACGSNNTTDGDAGADLAIGAQADLANVPLVSVSGTLTDASGSGNTNPPIAGATMLVVGSSPAAQTTTAGDGSWTLMAAAGATVFISANAANYVTGETGLVVPSGGATGVNFNLISTAQFTTVASAAGVTVDAYKGLVVVNFHGANKLGGFGATVSAAHDPSFAFDANGNPMTSNATIANGDNSLVFPNVVIGTAAIALTAPAGHSCAALSVTSWRVDASTFTFVDAQCQ